MSGNLGHRAPPRKRRGRGFREEECGYADPMSTAWLIAAIPGTLAFLAIILALSAVAEERFLSPRSLILAVVRARRNTPEYAEAYVARQLEQLLADQRGRPARP